MLVPRVTYSYLLFAHLLLHSCWGREEETHCKLLQVAAWSLFRTKDSLLATHVTELGTLVTKWQAPMLLHRRGGSKTHAPS